MPNTMSGGAPTVDFPEGMTKLEKGAWSNYHLKSDSPGLFPSTEENQRLWQEIEMDRQIDYTPAHEIHATELPDYHYWPAIQNDLNSPGVVPGTTQRSNSLTHIKYHRDQTDYPRFHKNGVPKTPPQEQLWYMPLTDEGRFDWKKNITEHAVRPIFSEEGWDRRYMRRTYVPWLAGRSGMMLNRISHPIYFKHRELPNNIRFFRGVKGSFIALPWVVMFVPFLFTATHQAWAATQHDETFIIGCGATYRALHNNNHPWNPDIWWMKFYRNMGCYHGAI